MAEKKKASGTATKTNPKLWEAAKAEAKRRLGGRHSARAMQLAVQIYKKKGGGYRGSKPSAKSNKLKRWGKERWTTSSGKKSIEGGKARKYLPAKAWSKLSAKEKAAANASKQKGHKAGKQYTKTPKKIIKKVRRYRK